MQHAQNSCFRNFLVILHWGRRLDVLHIILLCSPLSRKRERAAMKDGNHKLLRFREYFLFDCLIWISRDGNNLTTRKGDFYSSMAVYHSNIGVKGSTAEIR